MNRNTLNWKNFLFFVLGKNYKNDMEKLKTEKKNADIFADYLCRSISQFFKTDWCHTFTQKRQKSY